MPTMEEVHKICEEYMAKGSPDQCVTDVCRKTDPYHLCCVEYRYCAFYAQPWFYISAIGFGVLVLCSSCACIAFIIMKKSK
uniref:Uncharacterized protein n=1 Tax=Caenorhabditis japonica TaxID=281687 RepID=A0A8R1EDI9_CAEJA